MNRKFISTAIFYVVVIAIAVVVLFPFLWMLSSSFKTQVDIIAWPPKLVFAPTLRNYEKVFGEQDFLKYFVNSTVVGTVAVGLSLVLGLPAAYSIARFTQRRLAVFILLARLMPGISFLMPWYIVFSRLDLMDSYTALILSHMLIGDGRRGDAPVRVLEDHPAAVRARDHHGDDAVVHLLVEQLHVLAGALDGEDEDAADRRLQLPLLRRGRLGRRDGGRRRDHGARDRADDDLPEIRREGSDDGGRQGLRRLSNASSARRSRCYVPRNAM
jgi:hypothetical protein